MTEVANKALARRFYEVFNFRNLDALDEFMAADFVDHNPVPEQGPGLAGVKATIVMYISSFSDVKLEPALVIAKDDYVTVYSNGTGTHDGEFLGNAATGKPVNFPSLDLWLVKDGRLAEGWHIEDMLGVVFQIGAMGE